LSTTINTGLTVEHAFITQRNHTSGELLYDAEVLKAECARNRWALWRESPESEKMHEEENNLRKKE